MLTGLRVCVYFVLSVYIEEARESMGRYYDRSHKDAPPYSAGDLVMLGGRHIRMKRAAKELDAKLFGPFSVVKDRSWWGTVPRR